MNSPFVITLSTKPVLLPGDSGEWVNDGICGLPKWVFLLIRLAQVRTIGTVADPLAQSRDFDRFVGRAPCLPEIKWFLLRIKLS